MSSLRLLGAVELALAARRSPASPRSTGKSPWAEAAAALTQPDETLGVTRGTLVCSQVFYGRRRVAGIETLEATLRFLASGGNVIVTEGRNLGLLESVVRVEMRSHRRYGRREFVVVTAAPSLVPAPSS